MSLDVPDGSLKERTFRVVHILWYLWVGLEKMLSSISDWSIFLELVSNSFDDWSEFWIFEFELSLFSVESSLVALILQLNLLIDWLDEYDWFSDLVLDCNWLLIWSVGCDWLLFLSLDCDWLSLKMGGAERSILIG